MSRWFLPFTTIDPLHLEETWEVGISERHFRRLQEKNHATAIARIAIVHEVLNNPVSLFAGWSRPEKDDCYVYAGTSQHDFRSIDIETPPPPNSLFLVFILPDGTIDLWNWRERAPGSTVIPDDVKGKLIWQQTKLPPN